MTSLVLQSALLWGGETKVGQATPLRLPFSHLPLVSVALLEMVPWIRVRNTCLTERGGREIGKSLNGFDQVGNKGGCKRCFDKIISQERRVEPRN